MKSTPLGLLIVVLATHATPAFATKADYCAAYAHDFADAQTQDKTLWQHKYEIANDACLVEPKAAAHATIIQPKIELKPKPKTTEPQILVPAEPQPLPTPSPAKLKLEPGSENWNTYCANKYTSFNTKTGTYTSRTGVERRCVVSNP